LGRKACPTATYPPVTLPRFHKVVCVHLDRNTHTNRWRELLRLVDNAPLAGLGTLRSGDLRYRGAAPGAARAFLELGSLGPWEKLKARDWGEDPF